ncbi:MAG: bifunctional (p)ppGpp synthetase/guanosine-3',5'-bis(diphosphate) 3'-pyrophosphohydrolase [Muribaculaceae bacterium]|nr:bifunctional (p)ppGpp synthetase/guanosine-3',5'-bis(diphosphate) 3'-pyrophosphohydrolase [Muribaculaceae bacterium]
MKDDYSPIIERESQAVFDAMAPRVSPEELALIKDAFLLARDAHSKQKRKTGEPYILHPINVAKIAASELGLGASSVIAAFLHDVVEDTDHGLEEIKEKFGEEVAYLVKVVTKEKKEKYELSKQLDNFKMMLELVQYDIRALLIKLADRLHNMRTLSSMRPDKQMKIAGETDYFYAPLANRLGLYNVKTELENLSLKFRCPHDYAELEQWIEEDKKAQKDRLERFCEQIRQILDKAGFKVRVFIEYRKPYSAWRRMHKYGDDFNHLKYRHFTDIVFENPPQGISEKEVALRIYAALTNHFNEKPGSIINYIDTPKENGYQSFHLKLLPDFGRWQEVHISSERMVRYSQLGCTALQNGDNVSRWIKKFQNIIRDISNQKEDGATFIEKVVSSFYNDDIMTFTPKGREIILPQKATVLDFAYEVHTHLGLHAKYARVNNFLTSVKAPLRRGDVVEIFTDENVNPVPSHLDAVVTYKARRAISRYLSEQPVPVYDRCPVCCPIPGEEVIGYKDRAVGRVMVHKRDCPVAIKLATQQGDFFRAVEYIPDGTLYPVTIVVTAVDRYHLFIDLVHTISNELNLSMDGFNTETTDSIVTCTIKLAVHSNEELQTIIHHISTIEGVDEVKHK